MHIAFARPKYLTRDDVPADVVDAERQTLETITRNEGKPEQALAEDRRGSPATGFFKTVALLDQPYAKDDKQSIAQLLGGAAIVELRPGRDRLSRAVPDGDARAGGASSSSRRVRRWPGRRAPASTAPRSTTTAHDIIDLRQDLDVDVAVVVGGGNFWRGRTGRDGRAWTPRSPTTSACSARS